MSEGRFHCAQRKRTQVIRLLDTLDSSLDRMYSHCAMQLVSRSPRLAESFSPGQVTRCTLSELVGERGN